MVKILHYLSVPGLLRRVFPKNVGPTVINSFLIMGIQALSGIMLARLLGPSGRGQLAICILWPALIASLGSLGIKDAVIYFTAKGERPERLVPTCLGLAVVQAVILTGAGFILLPLFLNRHEPDIVRDTLLFLLFIPLNLIGQYFISIYEGLLKIHFANFLRLIVPIVTFAVTIVLLITESPSVRIILYSHLGGNLVIVMVCLYAYVKENGVAGNLSMKLACELLRYGIRSHLGTITNSLNYKLDQMLISLFLPTQSLGFYVVAVSASGVGGSLATAFRLVLFPTAAKSKNLIESQRLISDFLLKTFVLVSFSSIVLLILFPFVFPLIYGEAFSSSILPAQILLVAVIFSSIRDILAFSHRALNHPLVAAKSEIYALMATGTGLIVLLPLLGITGAALASLLAYSVACMYNLWQMKKLYGFSPWALFKLVKVKQQT